MLKTLQQQEFRISKMQQIDLYLIGKHNIMQNILDLYYSQVDEQQLILDCGCGRGVYAFKLTNVTYVGLDVNSFLIKRAHKIHSDGIFVVGDATTLPFKSNVFNCAICSEVLEHISNDESVLTELARVLKFSGKLFLSVPNIDCNGVFVNWQRNLIDNAVGHFREGYSAEEISELIRTSGFKMRKSRFGCGPVTAIIESCVVKLGSIFGYNPSDLNRLFEGEKSFLVKVILKIYELSFPLLVLFTYLDRLLPKRYRSNMAFMAEKELRLQG